MKHRAIRTLIVLLLTAVLLTGCWDRIEINDIAIVMMTALDAAPGGKFRECIEVALTGQLGGPSGGGGGTGGDKVYYTNSAVGQTVRDASGALQQSMSRQLFFAHRRVLLVGEELARRGLADLFDVVVRIPENRMSAYIVITQGSACEVMSADTKLERFTGEAIREIITMQSAIPSDIKDATLALASDGKDAVLPYLDLREIQDPNLDAQEAAFQGFAFFRNDRMAGTLKQDKALGLLWLMNSVNPYSETIPFHKGHVSLEIQNGKSDIKPSLRNGRVHVSIDAKLQAQVLENLSEASLDDPDGLDRLARALEERIESNMRAALKDLQKHGSDALGTGTMVYRHFPSLWLDHYKDDWNEKFAQIPFDIQVNATISKLGMISDNVTKKEVSP
ncbi:Ger(x)C family spore germination protein [Xylanibacillus composti]|uniref:Putative spore germination protein YfkR n=1 Tax=Xylanibacillus composti TaxID=1572762 RepID=A0A8J4M2K6_9BACL|nr:Ger(x)C family spore germination protein [Xylanibacillus composti]MDT9725831.1 Ger(x)C family spore germination protein [Xylanibacillus composti]GIQ69215.1 putative spore germination protein YfkR [Xylanibacillus composti]